VARATVPLRCTFVNEAIIPLLLCPVIVFAGDLEAKLHPVAVEVNRVRRVFGDLHEFVKTVVLDATRPTRLDSSSVSGVFPAGVS
jgi:hypothetical protein